ncbi:hypothetical protein JK358_18105 [Nocardia sp. 2]|uniref:Protein-tyrosine-phosphatase-like N-terminal domain-containing protein n=1 Tax=Nocardia acididurans TaxID=2802282 RepID=A0ABS1M844_9NOCA|nr:hypothetical protein [Nocardia acididurans]MBL1076315.1 hypothetical protein [Nocardia acididurans]
MTESPVARAENVRGEPPLDARTALRAAAARLTEEFGDRIPSGTVDSLVRAAYDRVASQATVEVFLPLLAERDARRRLQSRADAPS